MASDAIPYAAGVVTNAQLGDKAPYELQGITNSGTGSVAVYDGTSAAGLLVLSISGAGTVSLNVPVAIHTGVFVVITGSAAGSLLTS